LWLLAEPHLYLAAVENYEEEFSPPREFHEARLLACDPE